MAESSCGSSSSSFSSSSESSLTLNVSPPKSSSISIPFSFLLGIQSKIVTPRLNILKCAEDVLNKNQDDFSQLFVASDVLHKAESRKHQRFAEIFKHKISYAWTIHNYQGALEDNLKESPADLISITNLLLGFNGMGIQPTSRSFTTKEFHERLLEQLESGSFEAFNGQIILNAVPTTQLHKFIQFFLNAAPICFNIRLFSTVATVAHRSQRCCRGCH
ncbi:response regulator 19 [Striga asiatica]|uniref:Response regulator 19 n=1 Tax=Striga asiatica TaxID=4170 RepID=A0A5A7RB18_STRAF|nr:response regulator 19 [Striga asiatica]